jgi:hypothetical protein
MAKAYMVVTYRSLSDPKALEAYAKLAGPAVSAAERDMRIVEGVA